MHALHPSVLQLPAVFKDIDHECACPKEHPPSFFDHDRTCRFDNSLPRRRLTTRFKHSVRRLPVKAPMCLNGTAAYYEKMLRIFSTVLDCFAIKHCGAKLSEAFQSCFPFFKTAVAIIPHIVHQYQIKRVLPQNSNTLEYFY